MSVTTGPDPAGSASARSSLGRWWRHLRCDDHTVARRFTTDALDAIEAAITAGERGHTAELRFVVEADLTARELWAGVSPRARALDVFSRLRVWDTEHNDGVLIYVLWADHAAEIVADRGIAARVAPSEWDAIVRTMTAAFAEGRCREGAVEAVEAVGALLARHFPAGKGDPDRPNELPDRPALI